MNFHRKETRNVCVFSSYRWSQCGFNSRRELFGHKSHKKNPSNLINAHQNYLFMHGSLKGYYFEKKFNRAVASNENSREP